MNIKDLTRSVELFAETPGAMGQDGPLRRVLLNGKTILSEFEGNVLNTRGAAYELESGLLLEDSNQKIIEFGAKYKWFNNETLRFEGVYEVDIITCNKFIECKNISWNDIKDLPKKINRIRSQLGSLQKLEIQENRVLEFYSKQQMPEILEGWLIKNNIKYYIG